MLHAVHDNPEVGVHAYVTAPVACSCAESAGQILPLAPPLTVGCGFTFTITVSVFTQVLPSVPVTMYEVVVVGVAVGFAQLVQDKPVVGVHVYEVAPVACNASPKPIQTVSSLPAFTFGSGLTVTVLVAVSRQPLAFSPITV